MKATITAILLIVTAVLLTTPIETLAQGSDTLVVSAMPPGNLNTVIIADTAAGRNPNRVYVLQQTGSVDTTYYITAYIPTNFNLTIIGKTDPVTGHPPVIAPFILSNNSAPTQFIRPTGSCTITLRNLYIEGHRSDSLKALQRITYGSADSVTCILDHDVFSDLNNVDAMWEHGNYNSIFMKNCEVRNCNGPGWQGLAWFWAISGVPVDTAEFVNNTFFLMARSIIGELQYAKYFLLDHNTFFLNASEPLVLPQATNAVIQNNIFYGLFAHGADSAQVKGNFFNNGAQGPAILMFDSLTSVANPPYSVTEAQRKIVVRNNDYFWPKPFYDNWDTLSDTASSNGPGIIVQPSWMTLETAAMFANHTSWPGLVATNNDSVDPGYASSIVVPAVDSLIHSIDANWTGAVTHGFFWQPGIAPFDVFNSVAQNWSNTQGYPVPENLAYSNDSLQSAGTRNFALGDLNWYPSQLKEWEAGGVNAIKGNGPQVPTKFDLSQNYPNPFNPSTNISVNLNQSGAMSLRIYNVLGQLVDVVADGYRAAGNYIFNVNMDHYASGVYFCTLKQGSNIMTKKMLLLK